MATQDLQIKILRLYQLSYGVNLICGRGRIRTYSALGQQIYSLPRLSNFAALPFLAEAEGFEPSEPLRGSAR